MKKVLIIFIGIILFLTGCGKTTGDDIEKDLSKKINKLDSYLLDGELEVLNNDEVYNYKIEVGYHSDNYRVTLTNKANNHTQVILKNSDGVYVLTPALNKSFKFQSDWPYSNSQIYLLKSIANDITNDLDNKFIEKNNKYVITTKVNYPNNKNLVKQDITLSKDLDIKDIKVYDKDSNISMNMKFNNIDYSPTFSKEYFKLNSIMDTCFVDEYSISSSSLDESIYPLFIPIGTKLANEEKIKNDNGERIILTFEGDKPFLLVEETAKVEEEFTIIPTYGEPFQLMDTLGVMTDNSLSWTSNGIEYYIVSDVLSQDELVEVARSIDVLPTMK